MTKLQEIFEVAELSDIVDAKIGASQIVRNIIRPWGPKEFYSFFIRSHYRTIGLDYDDMKELTGKRQFIVDKKGDFFEQYFGSIDLVASEISLPNNTTEEIIQIIIGRKKIDENLCYICVVSGATRMPGRIRSVRSDVPISSEMPILYASVPYPENSPTRERYEEHIEILIPKNLVYSR